MNDFDTAIEQEIVDKGLTAPRITLDHINALADSLTFKTTVLPDTCVTVCGAFLPCGFMVSLGYSACVSPENFNAETGQKVAKEKAMKLAVDKLWELEGYRLKHELS